MSLDKVKYGRISAPFIVALAGATLGQDGILVDAAGENAETYVAIPFDARRVRRVVFFALSIVAEADQMLLDIYINGATDNEPYNNHNFSALSVKSKTINFAASDILLWDLTVDAYPTLGNLSGGDVLGIAALYRAVGAPDCATNAKFRAVLIEWE